MSNFDLIIYDFDGTLLDTRYDIANSVNLTLHELGLPPHEPESIFTFVGQGVFHLMERAIEGTKFDDVEKAVERFRVIYSDHLVEQTRFYPNCRETVNELSHKKQTILSNKPEQFIKAILDKFNFAHPFFAIIGGDTLDQKKPDPFGVYYLMKAHTTLPERTLMVGDSSIDIETGKQAGIKTCGVTYGIGGPESVAEADFIIQDMAELPRLIN